jgi:hypothetical protein
MNNKKKYMALNSNPIMPEKKEGKKEKKKERRLRPEDCKFKASPGYAVRLCLKKQNKQENRGGRV